MEKHYASYNLEKNKNRLLQELCLKLSDIKTFLNHELIVNYHLCKSCSLFFVHEYLNFLELLKNLLLKYVHYASE